MRRKSQLSHRAGRGGGLRSNIGQPGRRGGGRHICRTYRYQLTCVCVPIYIWDAFIVDGYISIMYIIYIYTVGGTDRHVFSSYAGAWGPRPAWSQTPILSYGRKKPTRRQYCAIPKSSMAFHAGRKGLESRQQQAENMAQWMQGTANEWILHGKLEERWEREGEREKEREIRLEKERGGKKRKKRSIDAYVLL